MRELAEIVRLEKHGAHFDYYMMAAFWLDPEARTESGGHRIGRMARIAGSSPAGRMV